MARPFKHEVSILINEGRDNEARKIVSRAIVDGGGTVVGGRAVLGVPHTVMWRWVRHLGLSSSYDRRAGGVARQEKRRAELEHELGEL